MKLAIKFLFIAMVGVYLIVACGPVTPVPSAMPTATVTATATTEPTVTPTASPTITLTPTFTQTPLFPIPTRHIPTWQTPTPIATSNVRSAGFHLKRMDEGQLAQLISEMNTYSIENYPAMGDWYSDGQFLDSQRAVKLTIEEYLYRFPDSPDVEQYRWQVAFISAIDWRSERDSVDRLIISAIQKELDSGDVTPETLETYLDRYWFDLGFLRRIDNLFGDGKTAWFYEVVPQYWQDYEHNANPNDTDANWGGEGLFFVVRENLASHFDVILLNSAWNENESNIFDISDRNQNGIPEISLYVGSHSGTLCDGNLLVYEWNGQEFVELTRGNIEFIDCGGEFSYFEDRGRPAIRAKRNFSESEAGFVWDGKYYEFDRYLDNDLFNVWQSSYGDHKSEIAALTKMLGDEYNTKMEAGLTNFLRFRLGVVYALENQQDEAMKTFKQLALSPTTLPTDIFPEMAGRFLEYYEQSDILRACVETEKMYTDVLKANKDSTGYLRNDFFDELFGVSVGYASDPTCDEYEAFPLWVSSFSSDITDLPTELKQKGVSLAYTRKLDVNLDGQHEWLMVTNPYLSSFIVWVDGDKYQARKTSLFDYDANLAALKISIEKWEALPSPVMILTLPDEHTIVEFDPSFETEYLLAEFYKGNTSIKISNTNSKPLVQYIYSVPTSENWHPQLPWSRFQWNPRTQTFDEVFVEDLIFAEKDLETAVNLFGEVLPLMDAWEKSPYTEKYELPRFYYSAALAYELSGDDDQAVELYYHLWSKFPDSHYARIARLKLELNQ